MGRSSRPTLKSIAALAGVSPSAVSQILNNSAANYCSEEKKEQVRRIAREMNYHPSFGYRVMCGMKTRTVALIHSLPRYSNEEHIQLLQTRLMDHFELHGYSVYIAKMGNDPLANLDKVSDLIQRGSSLFIFIGMAVGAESLVSAIENRGGQYVSFGAPLLRRNVQVDAGRAIRDYISYLREHGRREFRLLFRKYEFEPGRRLNGLLESFPGVDRQELLTRYFRETSSDNLFCDDMAVEFYRLGYNRTGEIMTAEPEVEALVYENDYEMLGGVRKLQEMDYVVGKDILVCGFNHINAVRLSKLPLSTVDHHMSEVAAELIRRIDEPEDFASMIPPGLLIRDYNNDRHDLISNRSK